MLGTRLIKCNTSFRTEIIERSCQQLTVLLIFSFFLNERLTTTKKRNKKIVIRVSFGLRYHVWWEHACMYNVCLGSQPA